MRQLVLFSAHTWQEWVLRRYERLRAELPANTDLAFYYDASRLRLGATEQHRAGRTAPRRPNDWTKFKRAGRYFDSIIPGNEDGALLAALGAMPSVHEYERIWVIEYDVEFSGPWNLFFRWFDDCQADFLATTIVRRSAIPSWQLWRSLEVPDSVGDIPHTAQLRAFMPVMALRPAALDRLVNHYATGWAGHSECVLPTVALRAGLAIEDIGGDGEFTPPKRQGRLYRNSPSNDQLTPGTFVFRPAMESMGKEPDMLWHPVKPPSFQSWDGKNDRSRLPKWLFRRRDHTSAGND